MSDNKTIQAAWYRASDLKPYPLDADTLAGIVPAGGDWRVEAKPGAICRTVMWNRAEVAYCNPAGDLDDEVEGHIAMAIRALPAMDKALRCIIALADDPENLPLIQRIAETVMAYVEQPAPMVHEPEDC
jgi:hypothetical protein